MNSKHIRTRWAAVGAAVAITLGAGGIGLVSATSPTGAAAYVPIEPCRLADTRAGAGTVGPRNTPITAAETLGIIAVGDNGNCVGIPASATGLQLNVTALNATEVSFLTIWGSGSQPVVSSLNPQPGQPPTPNAVTTGLTSGGAINVYNEAGNVDVIVDIAGYYTDHNHDDTYYTKTEVDGKTHWASVNSSGAIERSSSGVTSTYAGMGSSYFLTFPLDVTSCVWTASLGGANVLDNLLPVLEDLGIAASQGSQGVLEVDPDEVAVAVYDDTGAFRASAFTLIVTCP